MSFNSKTTVILIKSIIYIVYIGFWILYIEIFAKTEDDLWGYLFGAAFGGLVLYSLLVYIEKKLRCYFSLFFVTQRKLTKAYKLSLKTNNWRVRQEYYLNLLWLKAVYNRTEKYNHYFFRESEYIFDTEILKVTPNDIQIPSKFNLDNKVHKEFIGLVENEFDYKAFEMSIDEECLPIPLYKLHEIFDDVKLPYFNFNLDVIPAKETGNKYDNDFKNDIKQSLKYRFRLFYFITLLVSFSVFMGIFFLLIVSPIGVYDFLGGGRSFYSFLGGAFMLGIACILISMLFSMFGKKSLDEQIKNRWAKHTINLSNKDIIITTNVIQVTEEENLHITNDPITIEIKNKELSVSGAYTGQYIIEEKEFEYKELKYSGSDKTKFKSIGNDFELEISILSGTLKIKFESPIINIHSIDFAINRHNTKRKFI